MLDPNDNMIFTVEDFRGITVKIGDLIARGFVVGRSAHTRIGKVLQFKRIPQDYGKPNYYVQVDWIMGEGWGMPAKPTLIFVSPSKNNDFFIVDLP